MGNLKEIRTRISSIESTQKITSSMKLVSAAKLRRAQTAIQYLRPYSEKLNEILHNLSGSATSTESLPLFEQRTPEKVMLVVITSNKGLCGAFNSNIVKQVHALIQGKYAEQHRAGNVQLICIGKKGNEQLGKVYPVVRYNEALLDNPDFGELTKIADFLTSGFLEHRIDKVDIVYNQFLNAATQRVTVEEFLPIVKLDTEGTGTVNNDYIIEPSPQEVLEALIPKILKNQLYKTLSDSIASEHGARMISMTKATDNATEILRDLRLKYNNARQSSITNELIEIVSGAEALKG
ncbi:MAG: ATP synthase F1 subunit gamma [Bacteroidales bacterium]|nr:ATP synthase F1 subunit gamma [Bacteroidales bacterium]MCR4857393.1 ATP synthase F1 subunit gamma [Bacteroidales bacterium]